MATTRPLVVDSQIRQSTNSDVLIQAQTQITASTPAAPEAGNVIVYGQTIAGKTAIAGQSESGIPALLQPSFMGKRIGTFIPSSGSTNAISTLYNGIGTLTTLGTTTARSQAAGSIISMAIRLGFNSSTTAGNFSGFYLTSVGNAVSVGNGTYNGFISNIRFMASDLSTVSGVRSFIGLSSSTSTPTNVEPSTITNCIGVAQLSTDSTQLYLVYGGTAAQTPIALGTGFPPMSRSGPNSGPYYSLTIQSPSTVSGRIFWQLDRLDNGASTGGSIAIDTSGVTIPSLTTLLYPRMWRCNNETALATSIDLAGMYLEVDY